MLLGAAGVLGHRLGQAAEDGEPAAQRRTAGSGGNEWPAAGRPGALQRGHLHERQNGG